MPKLGRTDICMNKHTAKAQNAPMRGHCCCYFLYYL